MRRGVTFTEIMICTVIVSILSISIFVSYSGSTEDARIAHNLQKLAKLQEQIEQAYAAAVQASYSHLILDDWCFAEAADLSGGAFGPGATPPEAAPAMPRDPAASAAEHKDLEAGAMGEAAGFAKAFDFFPSAEPLKLNEAFEFQLYQKLLLVKNIADYTREGFCVIRTRLGVRAAFIDPSDPEHQRTVTSGDPLRVYIDLAGFAGGAVFSEGLVSPTAAGLVLMTTRTGGAEGEEVDWASLSGGHSGTSYYCGSYSCLSCKALKTFNKAYEAFKATLNPDDPDYYAKKIAFSTDAYYSISILTDENGTLLYQANPNYPITSQDVERALRVADWFEMF